MVSRSGGNRIEEEVIHGNDHTERKKENRKVQA